MSIRLIAAPLFVATKFEAFADRGAEDLLGSHDLEDIINVLDGRPELPDEIARADDELRAYLSGKCASLLAMSNFMNYLPGLVIQDTTLPERVKEVAARPLVPVARAAAFSRDNSDFVATDLSAPFS